ncbi:MAG TPA: hypothetical protein VD886_26035 [Herpetosiphonaceae bacterium]|nr:hypothetical protein [Herpetosiphonaceae bacterium]
MRHSRKAASGAPDAQMVLVAQSITTTWTRQSSGGAAATRRGAVPKALPLPPEAAFAAAPATIVHSVGYHEDDLFAQPSHSRLETLAGIARRRVTELAIYPQPGAIRVAAEWSGFRGAPIRHPVPHLLLLRPDTWGQVTFNLRTGGTGGPWTYASHVINIGYYAAFHAACFMAAPPIAMPAFMADLW